MKRPALENALRPLHRLDYDGRKRSVRRNNDVEKHGGKLQQELAPISKTAEPRDVRRLYWSITSPPLRLVIGRVDGGSATYLGLNTVVSPETE